MFNATFAVDRRRRTHTSRHAGENDALGNSEPTAAATALAEKLPDGGTFRTPFQNTVIVKGVESPVHKIDRRTMVRGARDRLSCSERLESRADPGILINRFVVLSGDSLS
jgi:hypothetical protein